MQNGAFYGSVAGLIFNVYRLSMTSPARTAVKIAGSVLLAILLLYLALFFVLRSSGFRAWAQTELTRKSGFDVEFGRISLAFPLRLLVEEVRISEPRLRLTAERLSATLNPLDLLAPTVHHVILESPRLRLDLQELTVSAAGDAPAVAVRHLSIRNGVFVLASGDETLFELPEVVLQADDLDLGRQAAVTLRADLPALNGVAELILKGGARELETAAVVRAKESADASVPPLLRLDAKLRASEAATAEAIIDGKFHNLSIAENRFTGTLAARIQAGRGLRDVAFSAHANLTNFSPTFAASKLPLGNVLASFAGAYSLPLKKLTLKTARVASHLGSVAGGGEVLFDPQPSIAQARLAWQQIPLENLKAFLPPPLNTWTYRGHGQIEGAIRGPLSAIEFHGTARGEDVQLSGAGWKTAGVNIVLPIAWEARALRVDGAAIDLAAIDYGDPRHWRAGAERARATGSFTLKAGEPLTVRGRFEATGGRFNSPGNDRIGENLSLGGSFDWGSRPQAESLGLRLEVGIESGEVLWGAFFTDLGARKPRIEVDADYFPTGDRFECRNCVLNIPDVGRIAASGVIDQLLQAPSARLTARGDKVLPGAVLDHFVRENLHRRYPFLDRLGLDGELAFTAEVNGTLTRLSAAGQLSIEGGELRSRSNDWQVGPLALHLPFQIHWPETEKTSDTPRTGVLSLERARFGNQSFGPMRAPVSLAHNAMRFHQELRAAVFGGEIIVRDLFWPDIVADPNRLSLSLEARGLDLEELTATLDWPRFSGTLSGSIPQVEATANALKTRGTIEAELFGGRMMISTLEIDNPFSSLPAIRLDADLANIRLEQLSKTFAFGHISGILAGTIDGLVIVDGQPAQFQADFQSVAGNAEQRISVEALNKITVLSSGQNAGALYGGLAQFFDSFRYSKLGFKALLKNDRLTLRGVESRGDQEYLVVGSFLPPTVNVVNHTQVIAFSELLRRLERVASEKPEVK